MNNTDKVISMIRNWARFHHWDSATVKELAQQINSLYQSEVSAEEFESTLKTELDKLPYEAHADDGMFNDGMLDGFELGARWARKSPTASIESEKKKMPCGALHDCKDCTHYSSATNPCSYGISPSNPIESEQGKEEGRFARVNINSKWIYAGATLKIIKIHQTYNDPLIEDIFPIGSKDYKLCLKGTEWEGRHGGDYTIIHERDLEILSPDQSKSTNK